MKNLRLLLPVNFRAEKVILFIAFLLNLYNKKKHLVSLVIGCYADFDWGCSPSFGVSLFLLLFLLEIAPKHSTHFGVTEKQNDEGNEEVQERVVDDIGLKKNISS